MLNRVILIGRLTADPQLRYTPQGTAVANFTLAVDRSFSNQQGQKETDFIDIVCWRKLAETCANHLAKGRLIALEGRLQVRSYEAKDGTRRRAAEVVADNIQFLERKQATGGAQEVAATTAMMPSAPENNGDEFSDFDVANFDLDSDTPF